MSEEDKQQEPVKNPAQELSAEELSKQQDAMTNPAKELSPEELKLVSGGGVEIFLTIDGITGESQKSGAEGWIDVLPYQEPPSKI